MPVDAGRTASAPMQDAELRRLEARREPAREPGALAVWLGIADNSFTRQKTIKFGDASAVNSGRLWSIVTVLTVIGYSKRSGSGW